MSQENEIEAEKLRPTTDFLRSDRASCSAFEEWWQEYGLSADPPVLEMAYKEIALNGWVAAAEKCAIVCEFWGDKSRSVILTNYLPNVAPLAPADNQTPNENGQS